MRFGRSIPAALAAALALALGLAGSAHAQAECPNADTATADATALGAAVQCLLADERASAGVAALTLNAELTAAARDHASDMVTRQYFSVRSPSGEAPGARAERWNYGGGALGTQVAGLIGFGSGAAATPRKVFASWVSEPANRALLRNAVSRDVGVGVAPGAPVDAAGANATTYTIYLGSQAFATKPAFGKSVAAEILSGAVSVAGPGGSMTPLQGVASLPLGSRVDTRAGAVRVAAASDAVGGIQKGAAEAGSFAIGQSKGAQPVTEFALNQSLGTCKKRPKAKRRLWATGKGRFRTKGKYAVATVIEGRWLTEDSCAGTRVTVASGVALVTNRKTGKTKTVRAGSSLLVRRPR
jgi:uncharacterized protein YkwD